MKLPLTIILILVAIYLSQCNFKKETVHYPPDFSFQLKSSAFAYDSQKQLYTRNFTSKSISIKVGLTDNELQSIFEYIQQIEFISFPEKFECEKYGTITEPSFHTSIEVNYEKKFKQSTNTTGCSPKTQLTNSDNFDRLVDKIIRILESKKAIKDMPKSDIIFL